MSNFTQPKRKVVQIAAYGEGETTKSLLIALCNDGSLHCMGIAPRGTSKWEPLPPPPGCE
jgi:hypothetical protein